jgi:amidase
MRNFATRHAPQVNLPIASVGGLPVGLGLIGPPGSDEALLELCEQLMAVLAPRKDVA